MQGKPWLSKPYKNKLTLRADIIIPKGTTMTLEDGLIRGLGYLSSDKKFLIDMKYFEGLEKSQKAR